MLGFELVAQWLGIVVVDEHVTTSGGEGVELGEDCFVALRRGQMTHVKFSNRRLVRALAARAQRDRLARYRPGESVQAGRGLDGERGSR